MRRLRGQAELRCYDNDGNAAAAAAAGDDDDDTAGMLAPCNKGASTGGIATTNKATPHVQLE